MNKSGSGNLVALALVIIGAAAMAIATFLPFAEPTGRFAVVRSNTLIQHGGWWFLALAVAIAVSGYRASQHRRKEWVVPIVVSAIAAIAAIFIATNKGLRTLYPVGFSGTPDTSAPGMVAPFGVAIYVAGAGVAAAFIGSVLLRRPDDDIPEDWALEQAGEKKCPDCAETVLADAKVCKHCGYRFAPAGPSPAPRPKPEESTPPKTASNLPPQSRPMGKSQRGERKPPSPKKT